MSWHIHILQICDITKRLAESWHPE